MTKPHPVLSGHYPNEEAKQTFLRKIFDESAPHYEAIAKWGWFGSGHWYRKEALRRAGLKPGMKVLDVAAGTGPTARAVRDVIGSEDSITCLEPSAGMIAESKKLLQCEHLLAEAESMPVPDASCDFLSMGFALRHVNDLDRAFREFHRALRPGGKALILDLNLPKNRAGRFAMKLYFKHTLPFLTRCFTRSRPAGDLMRYYWETLETMVPPEDVVQALQKAGFKIVHHRLHLRVFSEYEAIRPE